MNATVTDAHRQKCADLASEIVGTQNFWTATDFAQGRAIPHIAFAQYVANTEAREQSIAEDDAWFAREVLAGKEDGHCEVRIALTALREGAGK